MLINKNSETPHFNGKRVLGNESEIPQLIVTEVLFLVKKTSGWRDSLLGLL